MGEVFFCPFIFLATASTGTENERAGERKRETLPRTQMIPRCRRRKVTKRKSIFLSETIKIYTVDLNDKLVTETLVKS